jgi:PST family polysaccharide transporter/lipopolysaccharide exporter
LARCLRGGAALAAGTVAERGARLVRNMILARLLVPDQFGLMAIVMAAGQLFEALTEIGIRASVVQNKRGGSDAFLNAAWWLSAVRGTLLYGLGVLVAPYVAAFYGEPSLSPLLRVAFLTMLLNGLTSTRLAVLQRNLEFGRYTGIMQGAGLAGTAVTLAAALFVRSVWALVIGSVAEAAFCCLASFVFCPLKPSRHIDRACLKQLLAFTRGMAGLSLLTLVILQADVFVLARICSKAELGMYALALSLATMPLMVFSRVFQPLMLPVLSEAQDDLPRLRGAVLRMTRLLLTFGIPLTASLAICGRPLLALAYGPAYAVMAGAFGVLCVYFLFYMLGVIIASTYLAVGCPALHRRFTVIRAVLVGVLIYPASSWWGPVGAAGALLVSSTLANFFQLRNLDGLLSLSLRTYLATASIGLASTGIVAAPAIVAALRWPVPPGTHLLLGATWCAVAWVIGGWLLHKDGRRLRAVPRTVCVATDA